MEKVEAYIQPFMLQKVTDGLHRIHIHGIISPGVEHLRISKGR